MFTNLAGWAPLSPLLSLSILKFSCVPRFIVRLAAGSKGRGCSVEESAAREGTASRVNYTLPPAVVAGRNFRCST